MSGATARPNPCPSCPYRRDVPAGVWAADEYAKLPAWDGEIVDQVAAGAFSAFDCHQGDGSLCAGWLGHRDPFDLLAVRLGVASGALDESVLSYRTAVPLFASGADAAAHGRAGIDTPDARARTTVEKIIAARTARAAREERPT